MCTKKIQAFWTCRRILDLNLIVGLMFNHMIKTVMPICIVDMIIRDSSSPPPSNVHSVPRFHWNEHERNEILGSLFWGYILTQIPGGRLSEMFGTKVVFGTSMFLASTLTLLVPWISAWNYYALIGLRVALGLALGVSRSSIPPMASQWVPISERAQFTSHLMAASLGIAITMPFAGFIIATIGWPYVFYITGTVGLIWCLVWYWLVFDTPSQHPRISDEERKEIESKIGSGGSKSGRIESGGSRDGRKSVRVPWAQIMKSGPVWAIILVNSAFMFFFNVVFYQLPTYMNTVLHYDIKKNGLLSSVPYLAQYLAALAFTNVSRYLQNTNRLSTTNLRKLFTILGCFGPGFLLFLQGFFGSDRTFSVLIFTFSLLLSGAACAGFLCNNQDIAPDYSGTVFGIANAFGGLASYFSTKIVALLLQDGQEFREWRWVFWIVFINFAVTTGIYLLLGSGELQEWSGIKEKKEREDIGDGKEELERLRESEDIVKV